MKNEQLFPDQTDVLDTQQNANPPQDWQSETDLFELKQRIITLEESIKSLSSRIQVIEEV